MTTEEIINDLKSRGEKLIELNEELIKFLEYIGVDRCRVIEDELVCVDCKTVY